MNDLNNQELQTSETPKSNATLSPVAIGLGILVLAAIGVGIYSYQQSSSQDAVQSTQQSADPKSTIANWKELTSKRIGMPVVVKDKLYIYSPDNKKTTYIDNQVWFNGHAGFGESGAYPSPDMLYTVYIGGENQSLTLVSNDTLEKQIIAPQATYITGWATDSKELVYYIEPDNINSRVSNDMGADTNATIEKFDPNKDGGFFLFEIATGKVQKLGPVENVEAISSGNTLLTHAFPESENLVLFNWETFEADYKFIKDTFGFGTGQFSFSRDGKKWAFTRSFNPTSDAAIILADFPNIDGIIIDQGDWAQVQGAHITADGSKVAYQKAFGYNDGIPNLMVMIYNTADKKTKEYTKGFPKYWVDNRYLVIGIPQTNLDPSYAILDSTTGKIEPIPVE